MGGGSAISTTINNGYQDVFGSATSTTVNNGGQQNVSSGGVAISTIVNGGQVVIPGGSATSITINGGNQRVYGNVTSTTVNSGGQQNVSSGGRANSTTVSAGGILNISSGGSATSTTINSGGTQGVLSGGRATATTIAGGTQAVYGVVGLTVIDNDGVQNLLSGGIATNTTIFACVQNVSGGATASATTINSGGTQNVLSSGIAVSTTVNNGGLQYVYSGGTATDTTVNSGGLMSIASGAVIGGTTTLVGGIIGLAGDGDYTIPDLAATGGTVKLASGGSVGRSLTVDNLSGSANFVINTDLAAGTADQITVGSATGSTANTLAVNYDPAYATGQNATGSATFATVSDGSASFTARPTEAGAYSYTPTLESTTSGSTTTWAVTALTAGGESETVRTAGDAATGSLMAWRTENNNLAKRMGELRNAGGEAGIWLRTYRGRQEATVGGRATNQQYTALQGGWDRKSDRADGTLFTGWTIGYLEGNSTYNRGTGDASSFSAGVYRSWLGSKGHYTDIIAKVGRVSNSYTNYLNDAGNTRVDGSFRSWGTSLSAEYGHRRQLTGGWYVEPQAEINFSRLNGASYTASDGTRMKNDAVNSLVGRLGVAGGRDTGKVHYYGKVSLAREFAAKAGITAASGGLAPISTRHDLKESWLEFALGLSGKLGQRTDGYLEISRTTGDKAKTPWQVNVGARWNF